MPLSKTDQVLSGDDTGTKVLDLGDAQEGALAHQIEEELGWKWPKADGTGDKIGLNVSLLMGRSKEQDPRSLIRFFRTHQGSVGNLLTNLLERRTPKAGPVIFQGDLSATNLPSPQIMTMFDLSIAGCGAHARRPFWRLKDEDPNLCYFMLRGFLALSRIEKRIDLKGRTKKRVLFMRGRYGRMIWQTLYNRCVHATTGSSPGPYTLVKTTFNEVWPPGSELYRACKYVINHFEELTHYLRNPSLAYTNNGSERALRIEKCMLSGSKFRKTRDGRVVLDILRTISATCVAAGVGLKDYICWVGKHGRDLQNYPEKFTPYAYALHIEENKKA